MRHVALRWDRDQNKEPRERGLYASARRFTRARGERTVGRPGLALHASELLPTSELA